MLTGDYTTLNPDWSAYENGNTFTTVESGTPSQPLISTQHYAGNYSIQIQVPTDNTGNKERFEYTLLPAADSNGLHFDTARYSGFAFRVASPTSSFQSSALIWQAWQGSPWGPPASFKLTASSAPPFTVGLYIRNMETGPDSAVSDVKLWSSSMIQPDTWYAVVIYLAPRYTNNNGDIKLWLNGTQYVDCTTNIGYDPSQVAGAYNGLDLKNGIYQPNANNGHTLFFDQLIVADTFAEAAATPPPLNTPPSAAGTNVSLLRNTFADVDLATLAGDPRTPFSQCLYTIGLATNGSVALLADGHTARFTSVPGFIGTGGYSYTVTDNGEDPRVFLHYSFEPPDSSTNAFIKDQSGHLRDGNLLAVGSGSFAISTNTPFPPNNTASLQLAQTSTTGAARLSRFVSNPAELNFSESSWTFATWFQRATTTDNDFLFYMGSGNGFGGDGDELQFYCPNGSSTLAIQHYNITNALDVNFASAATVPAHQWHHAALVYQRTNGNSGLLRAYLDGMEFAATNVTWSLIQSSPLVFGGHNSTNSSIDRWLNGCLDDIVIFTNALSAAEISRLATRTVNQFGGLSATNTVNLTVTNYSRPSLSSMPMTNGVFAIGLSGSPGASFTIQTSTNLLDWSDLFTTNPATVPFYFVDASASSISHRFYRAYIGP
jgi:hypothetical protein